MPDGPSHLFVFANQLGGNNFITYFIIFLLILFGGLFSASETALASCNRIRMKVKADDGKKMAKIVCRITDKFDHAVSALLIGNNIVAVFVSSISTLLFVRIIGTESIGALVATIASTALCFLFSDTLPKSLARIYPDQIALALGWFVYALMILVLPFSYLFHGLNWLIKKIFRIREEPKMTEEDFTNMIESIEEEGILEEQESDIIQNSLDFQDTMVKDVFTPVEKMYAIDINQLTHEKLNQMILDAPYSRIPIYRKDVDHIIGILVVNSYLKAYFNNKKVSIRSTLKRVYTVDSSIDMNQLLEGFNKHKTHIAIVKSKEGKTLGMVTMEDLLDELVGETPNPNDGLKRGEQQ